MVSPRIASTAIVRPPGPPPPRGTVARARYLYNFMTDAIGMVGARFAEHGDVYYVANQDGGLYVIRHPDHVREVLIDHAAHYRKTHTAFARIARVLGQGLLTTDGDTWRRHRRMIQPAFRKPRLEAYSHMMVEESERLCSAWHDGATLDMGAAMTELTLRVVSRSLFSHDVEGDMEAVTRAVAVFQDSIAALDIWPSWLPSRTRTRRRRAIEDLDSMMHQLIRQRRERAPADAHQGEPPDLLQMLIDVRDQDGDGAGLSDQEIRDQLVTFFVAGHETTSHALTWTLYLLSEHPAVEAKLHAELERVLGGRSPTFADLDQLEYTGQVVKEALRLYPPAYMVARKAARDTRIGEYQVPAGSEVALWLYFTHHDERWYPEPEAFQPERFADASSAERHKHAYLPFGLGPRTCIGKTFAMVEAVLILATLAQRFTFDLAPGQRVAMKTRVTLMPRYGMKMAVHARQAVLSTPRAATGDG